MNEKKQFKVVIVGEYSSGKSAIHRRIVKGNFDQDQSSHTVSSTFATKFIQMKLPKPSESVDQVFQDKDDSFSQDLEEKQEELLKQPMDEVTNL